MDQAGLRPHNSLHLCLWVTLPEREGHHFSSLIPKASRKFWAAHRHLGHGIARGEAKAQEETPGRRDEIPKSGDEIPGNRAELPGSKNDIPGSRGQTSREQD